MSDRYYDLIDSPLGILIAHVDGDGKLRQLKLPAIDRSARPTGPKEPTDGKRDPARLTAVRGQLDEYFAGRRRRFELDPSPSGSAFQRRAWDEMLAIPYGETRSYGEIAKALGYPGGAQAVGLAAGANPIPIVIPCHRVLGHDGSLTGFGGGLPAKATLLRLEGAHFNDPSYLPLFDG